ncbi:MAG: ferritin-like domain-containing protein [Thermoanaerobaculia bacterium]
MAGKAKGKSKAESKDEVTRKQFIANLNEDLAREYQAIVSYVIYSQAIKGAQYMTIAKELEVHAGEELQHALIIAKAVDYLGGMPTNQIQPIRTSEDPKAMLRFDLENEVDTIRNYRARVRQADFLEEYAIAEQLREILMEEQDHAIELATALGIDVPVI